MLHVDPAALALAPPPSFNPIAYVANLRARGIQPSISWSLHDDGKRIGLDIENADPDAPLDTGPSLAHDDEQLVVSVLLAEAYISAARASGMVLFPHRSAIGGLQMAEMGQEEEGPADYGSCARRFRDRPEMARRGNIAPGILAAVLCADLGLDPNDAALHKRVNELHANGGLKVVKILSPDEQNTRLLELEAPFEQAWAAVRKLGEECEGDDSEEAWAAIDDACKAAHVIVDEIEALKATTIQGLRLKARAVSWCHSGEPITADALDVKDQHHTTDMRLAVAIINDLLAMEARA